MHGQDNQVPSFNIPEAVAPLSFSFTGEGVLTVNGSMGNLSVLFDGVTPTLTGLDGDTWARQLLVLDSNTTTLQFDINFKFIDAIKQIGVTTCS